MSKTRYPTIVISKATGQGTLNQSWFLRQDACNEMGAERPVIVQPPPATPATFQPLINGQTTFETLYDFIAKAKHSIDIAIWGFQPSMLFKRDGESPCIGRLLIQKAVQGIEVKVLVWSMWMDLQTIKGFGEANLGNAPELMSFQQKGKAYQSEAQRAYDYWWYRAVAGKIGEKDLAELNRLNEVYSETVFRGAFTELYGFSFSDNRVKLQVKKRSVKSHFNHYPEASALPVMNRFVLYVSPSHHQKTVLIDYIDPPNAVGFVLEHNILDEYWDESSHYSRPITPYTQRNAPIPLQDVSSLVTGKVLWDINHNFCQSWDRSDSRNLVGGVDREAREAYNTSLASDRRRSVLTRDSFAPRSELGELIMAQILRTYDNPKEEHIRAMYLENIKKASHFIYTENQYFRCTELVRAYQSHWQRLKDNGREVSQPLYWFVVTNSSDAGIGSGTYNTYQMLKLLGREDVLPGVSTQLDSDNLNDGDYTKYDDYRKKRQELEEQLETLTAQEERGQGGEAVAQKKAAVLEELSALSEQEQQAIQAQYEEMKQLKREVSDAVGIRTHICTLTSMDTWQEVYIHSKVTIIDDVFTFIGSANLNTRSMQVDTELGIISECQAVARALRYDLWNLHTNHNPKANPHEMNRFNTTEAVFDVWEDLMQRNFDRKVKNEPPQQPLCEFLRLTTEISRSD
ncbi:phospholipase D-like domain-containing protein [Avibacterium avium]|uniref:phospholipase D-like domain-containing protein n=1 Tax=Avibacterium avium TaxID=751 RepID=UPI003BF85DC1